MTKMDKRSESEKNIGLTFKEVNQFMILCGIPGEKADDDLWYGKNFQMKIKSHQQDECSIPTLKSLFYHKLSMENIIQLIREALRNGKARTYYKDNNTVYINYECDAFVGILNDKRKQSTKGIRVCMNDSGEIFNAFPDRVKHY